jgi:hypothetical protein
MGYTLFWDQLCFSDITYKNVIKLIPLVISPDVKFSIESWGFVIGINDNDCAAIERTPSTLTYVKTNRLPYTKDVMKALILMVEFGAAQNLGHDDHIMTLYLEALDEVHAKYPLVSYDLQKAYFMYQH